MARIKLVLQEERDDPRRGGRHEGFLEPCALEGRVKIRDVPLERSSPCVLDRPCARWRAEDPKSFAAEFPFGVGRELGQVCDGREAAFAVEAGEPVFDVRRVSGLAELAVAQDVDASVDLLLDDFPDRVVELRLELAATDRLPLLLQDHAQERGGSRQAACVSRENAVAALLHGRSPPCGTPSRASGTPARSHRRTRRKPAWGPVTWSRRPGEAACSAPLRRTSISSARRRA